MCTRHFSKDPRTTFSGSPSWLMRQHQGHQHTSSGATSEESELASDSSRGTSSCCTSLNLLCSTGGVAVVPPECMEGLAWPGSCFNGWWPPAIVERPPLPEREGGANCPPPVSGPALIAGPGAKPPSTRARSTTRQVQLSSLRIAFTAVHTTVWEMRDSGALGASCPAAERHSVTASCDDMKPKIPSEARRRYCWLGRRTTTRNSGRPEMTCLSGGPCCFAQ
mmetsp:Transcript_66623/g.161179  ORF Transcript_66623/g.161179 Transcript_66623/m.161179 type:complete len:222 (-) Transcript_66623:216-881(-)